MRVADWPGREAKCIPVASATAHGEVHVAGFLGRWIDNNRASLLAGLDSAITLGFEARLAGQMAGPAAQRLAADSDLYKWLEGACYLLARSDDGQIRSAVGRTASLIVGCQHEDGYINTQVPPKTRFDPNVNHNLYIAGHFFEAAVAHHRATGEARLLEAACRWADYLVAELAAGNPYFATVGAKEHAEYELGLLRLSRETGDSRYLEFALTLARLCTVGPTVAATKAGAGALHAVRLGYLLAGYADLFLETGDRSLVRDLPALWNELVDTRMYVTGAIGSHGEIISGEPFDLPHTQDHPHRTMGETCAAVAMVMFSWRMHSILGKARVFDVIERVPYNHILGAVSPEGLAHFYYNPMRVVGDQSQRTDHWHTPATSRCRLPELNRTTCCMPNLWGFFGALPEYLYSADDSGLFVNLYTESTVSHRLPNGSDVALATTTEYPNDGAVTVRYAGPHPQRFPLRLRVPAWARAPRLRSPDGSWQRPPSGEYWTVEREWRRGDAVTLELDLTPQLLLSDTRVVANRDHVVLSRGPLRYCLESEDLDAPVEAAGVSLRPGEVAAAATTMWQDELAGGLHTLRVPGWIGAPSRPTPLTLVPWYARANRSTASRWVVFLPHVDATHRRDVADQIDKTQLCALAGQGRWQPFAGNPVLTPGPYGSWDGWNVATMSVVQAADLLHLYYEAGVTGVEDYQIGHATSADGVHWQKDPANPVLPRGGAGSWDDAETWDPFVLFEDGLFKMWYGGTARAHGDPALRNFQLGFATSRDGTHFEERRRISSLANRGNGLGQISFRRATAAAAGASAWVMDGNYRSRVGDITFGRATNVAWLNYHFLVVFYRALKRSLFRWAAHRQVCNGNYETLRGAFLQRDSILAWVILTHYARRRRYRAMMRLHPGLFVELTTPRQATVLLAALRTHQRGQR